MHRYLWLGWLIRRHVIVFRGVCWYSNATPQLIVSHRLRSDDYKYSAQSMTTGIARYCSTVPYRTLYTVHPQYCTTRTVRGITLYLYVLLRIYTLRLSVYTVRTVQYAGLLLSPVWQSRVTAVTTITKSVFTVPPSWISLSVHLYNLGVNDVYIFKSLKMYSTV